MQYVRIAFGGTSADCTPLTCNKFEGSNGQQPFAMCVAVVQLSEGDVLAYASRMIGTTSLWYTLLGAHTLGATTANVCVCQIVLTSCSSEQLNTMQNE